VHLHAATHLLLLPSIRQREMCAGCCRDDESDLVRGILGETASSGLGYPLYVVSNILSSILNFFTHIHPLYHPLFILSTMGSTCHFI
jgi:hypothetical protein